MEGLVNWIQLDVMDGHFVLPVTWSSPDDLMDLYGNVKIEAHLMINRPEEVLAAWMACADRIIIHIESTNHLDEIIDVFSNSRIELGVAIKMDTPVEVIADFADKIRLVQLMSIDKLGYYGAQFDAAVYDRIKKVRQLMPKAQIAVDGGVNETNINLLAKNGVNNFVIGTTIWNSPNVPETISSLIRLAKE